MKTFINTGLLLGAAALQLAFFLATARALGPAGFGELAAILAFALPMAELSGLGAGDRLIQRVSRFPSALAPLFFAALVTIAVTAPVLTLVAAVLCKFLATPALGLVPIALIAGSEILAGRVSLLCEQIFIAREQATGSNLIRLAVSATRFLFGLGFLFLSREKNLTDFAAGYAAVVAATSLALLAITMARCGRPRARRGVRWLWGPSFALHHFGRVVAQNIDRLLLALILPAAALGIYAAGARILQMVLVPVSAVQRSAYPGFFRAGRQGFEAVLAYSRRIGPKVVGVAAAAALGAMGLAWTLPSVLGEGFQGSSLVGTIMAGAGVLIALQYIAGDALTGADRQALRAKVSLATIALSSLIVLAGARWGGVDGAAYGYLIAQAVAVMAFVLVVRRAARLSKRPI